MQSILEWPRPTLKNMIIMLIHCFLNQTVTCMFLYPISIFHSCLRQILWTGYNRDAGWNDGSVFSWTNWCGGEPNGPDECAFLRVNQNGCWNDVACGSVRQSICQISGNHQCYFIREIYICSHILICNLFLQSDWQRVERFCSQAQLFPYIMIMSSWVNFPT